MAETRRRLTDQNFITWALEISLAVDPEAPGLTQGELTQVAERLGLSKGRVIDLFGGGALGHRLDETSGRLRPNPHSLPNFAERFDIDVRNGAAIDALMSQLTRLAADEGKAAAIIPRDVLLATAAAKGHDEATLRHSLELLKINGVTEADGVVRLKNADLSFAAEQAKSRDVVVREHFAALRKEVEEVMSRRDPGHPKHADPIRAFGDVIPRLGHARMRLWWELTTAELRTSNPLTHPTIVTVLSAACAEAALMMLADFRMKANDANFAGLPAEKKNWGMKGLLSGAQKASVFGPPGRAADALRGDIDQLIEHRQRIHVAAVLDGRVSVDLKPEQATRARHTLETMLRALLDWVTPLLPP